MKLKTTLFSALALMSVSLTSNAQFGMNDTTNYSSFSLEELMNVEIVAVSKKAESSFDRITSYNVCYTKLLRHG